MTYEAQRFLSPLNRTLDLAEHVGRGIALARIANDFARLAILERIRSHMLPDAMRRCDVFAGWTVIEGGPQS